jgi:hypothetical protein
VREKKRSRASGAREMSKSAGEEESSTLGEEGKRRGGKRRR